MTEVCAAPRTDWFQFPARPKTHQLGSKSGPFQDLYACHNYRYQTPDLFPMPAVNGIFSHLAKEVALILLTWNRDYLETWPLEAYEKGRISLESGKTFRGDWSVGRRVHVPIGTECFMLIQGKKYPRGLVAKGVTTSEPESRKHWKDAKKKTNYVDILWSKLLPVNDAIPSAILSKRIPQIPWIRKNGGWIQSSGYDVPSASEKKLRNLWSEYSGEEEIREPGELAPGEFIEGGTRTIIVNRYERDPRARAACLAHHGNICLTCGFNAIAVYGNEIGAKIIHVHHIMPMSARPKSPYSVNPTTDLIPLCPNCHNAIHKSSPVMTPQQLKRRIRRIDCP